jgi:hypothetical protein
MTMKLKGKERKWGGNKKYITGPILDIQKNE